MSLAAPELCQRLRSLADGCEESARNAKDGYARNLWHVAARDARRAASVGYLGDRHLRHALAKAEALAHTASLYESDPDDFEPQATPAPAEAISSPSKLPAPPQGHIAAPTPDRTARQPRELLNARQLAERFGMSERGAREVIKRGWRRNLEGFCRDGALWFAEPQAFRRLLS